MQRCCFLVLDLVVVYESQESGVKKNFKIHMHNFLYVSSHTVHASEKTEGAHDMVWIL